MAFLLIALNETQNLVLADHSLSKTAHYRCPSCKTPVHLKLGTVIRPHFAHFQNEACDVFSEGETLEHVEGKLQLKEWIEKLGFKVKLEAYIPKLKQRPDLLVQVDDKQIALEFQCSFIPIQKVIERTKGYLNAGYEVIWILGESFNYRNTLTEFQKACLFQRGHQLQLFHYNTEKQRLTVRSQFYYNQAKQLMSKKHTYKTNQHQKLKRFYFEQPIIGHPNVKRRHYKLIHRLTPRTNPFTELLYLNQENLIGMPKELYAVVPSEWMLQTFSYEWKYRFILWLESVPTHKVITKKVLTKWLNQEELKYSLIPQATDDQLLTPFYEFLNILTRSGAVKEVSNKKWTVQQPLKRYKYLEEKFKKK